MYTKFRKLLSKDQKLHIRHWAGESLTAFKHTLKFQKEHDIVCWECRSIAIKCGIPLHDLPTKTTKKSYNG